MKKTYHIKTFGCQMNVSDSERILSFLEKNGLKAAEKIENADIVILNTCGVRQMAEDRVFGMIKNLKKSIPTIKIVVTGCLANRKDIHRRMKGVDLFIEIKDIESILEKLNMKKNKVNSEGREGALEQSKNEYSRDYFKIIPKYKNSFHAYIPIMTGCDNFCSYCVVPNARGRETSRKASEIVSEIKNLISNDYKEITLLGQNVNSYRGSGKDSFSEALAKENNFINFSQLLKKINAIPGKFWINFVSSHPKDMSDDLINTITSCKKVCEHIHLPIQSGDDKILEKMNRKYTKAHYEKIIRKVKKSFKENKPNSLFSISSDIIVGFPGETKKQFEKSAKIMEKMKFDLVFFGQYSPRPGTAAWNMNDSVSNEEKVRREITLNEILKKTSLSNNKKFVGRTEEVLIEKEKNGSYYGKTRTMKNIKIKMDKNISIGNFMKVKITKANIWNLEAELL